MNYIREMNAFLDWLETNQLEASTQTLWFHLMGIANKSGWPEWFTVANLTLQAKVGVTENTMIKHRNILVQRGRIEYKNMGKQKYGKYRLIPFSAEFTANIEVKPAVNLEVKPAVNLEVKGAGYCLNDLKGNDSEKERDRLLRLVNEHQLSGIGAFGLETIYSYIGTVEPGVIELAIKAAANKPLGYFTKIINNWIKDGKTTVALVIPIPEKGQAPPQQPEFRGKGSYGRGTGKPQLKVVKDDRDYPELTPEQLAEALALAESLKARG